MAFRTIAQASWVHAELLLRHEYNLVMMDSRAHGESGGEMATYGWKERYDTMAIMNALYFTKKYIISAHWVSPWARQLRCSRL